MDELGKRIYKINFKAKIILYGKLEVLVIISCPSCFPSSPVVGCLVEPLISTLSSFTNTFLHLFISTQRSPSNIFTFVSVFPLSHTTIAPRIPLDIFPTIAFKRFHIVLFLHSPHVRPHHLSFISHLFYHWSSLFMLFSFISLFCGISLNEIIIVIYLNILVSILIIHVYLLSIPTSPFHMA